jgi:hypothetical protein
LRSKAVVLLVALSTAQVFTAVRAWAGCGFVTGATPYAARPLARELGIEHVVCTELEVDAEELYRQHQAADVLRARQDRACVAHRRGSELPFFCTSARSSASTRWNWATGRVEWRGHTAGKKKVTQAPTTRARALMRTLRENWLAISFVKVPDRRLLRQKVP